MDLPGRRIFSKKRGAISAALKKAAIENRSHYYWSVSVHEEVFDGHIVKQGQILDSQNRDILFAAFDFLEMIPRRIASFFAIFQRPATLLSQGSQLPAEISQKFFILSFHTKDFPKKVRTGTGANGLKKKAWMITLISFVMRLT